MVLWLLGGFHIADPGLYLVMGSGLRTEVASGSSSETNTLAGSGSVVGGGTHT